MNDAAPRFQIDKSVALPKRVRALSLGRKELYPWSHMRPGDSFFAPNIGAHSRDKRDGLKGKISPANAKRRYPGSEWAVRAVTENGVNGVRVWRVK